MRAMNRQKQRGLSLVELMIALLLGSLLTLGATQIFLSSNTTYNLTDGIARIQENARFASSFLGKELREAGSNGCLFKGDDDSNENNVTDIRANIQAGNLVGRGIVGWEAVNTTPGDSLQLPDSDEDGNLPLGANNWSNATGLALPNSVIGEIVEGTDVFMVEGAKTDDLNGNTVTNVNAGAAAINLSGDSGLDQEAVLLVVSGGCTTGIRFHKGNSPQGTSITAMGGINNSGVNFPQITDGMDTGLTISVFRSSLYYIGNGVNGPALFRQPLEDDAGSVQPPQEIMGGVENMQLLYGALDVNDNINNYVTANNITDWARVGSVRIALLMRSENNARNEPEQRTFNLLGLETTTPNDRRVRLKTTNTVAIRNRMK